MTTDTGPRLTIDLDALARNYASLRAVAPSAEMAAVVKADGYGLGAGPIARRLWGEGARTFFVARLSEGVALRRELKGREAAIFVLDGLLAEPATYMAADLVPVLNTYDQARAWREAGFAAGVLQVDTGMNRLGVSLEDAQALASDGFSPTLVMSHLACASDSSHPMNTAQLSTFHRARGLFPDARASLANSAGAALGPDYHFDLVRPGIALYAENAVATLTAPVLQIREISVGDAVGYGADWVASRPSRVATIGAGYADGLLRAASTGGLMLEGRIPIVGRISMDMLALDVTDAPAIAVGDRIELFGAKTSIHDLAVAAGTITYEVLTRLSHRAERTYFGDA